MRDRATKGVHPFPPALILALGLGCVFGLAAAVVASIFPRGTPRDPLRDLGVEGGRISLRQPGGRRHTVLDLATGALADRGWPGPVGWRPPERCDLRGSNVTCVFPNGVFRFADSRVVGRTDAGEWKAFHFPAHNSSAIAMYGIGDKVLIESTGFVSTLECIDARSGRSVWAYVWSHAYNADVSPWAPYLPGPPLAEWLERAEFQTRQGRFGVYVTEDPSSVEPYGGSLVIDPRASEAPAAHSRAIAIGWAALAVAVAAVVAAAMRRHANGMVACLILLGVLLLTVGYLDTRLLVVLCLAFAATAALAGTLSRGVKRVFVALVVLGTAGLWILPSVLRSIIRT